MMKLTLLTVIILKILHFVCPFLINTQCKNIFKLSDSKNAYLSTKDPSVYLSSILRTSVESTKACIKDNIKFIEIAFPEIRKSDLSVTESLNTNRAFVKEYVKSFSSYGKNVWVLFPDNKELKLAADIWGTNNPFTLTSLNGASKEIMNREDAKPEVMIAVNPGFNVEEWIELANINTDSIVIVINGNLDRLRNGYYPSIFYPGLTKVTNNYYKKFIQAYFIQSIAVSGDSYGSWLTKIYSENWKLLIKSQNNQYNLIREYMIEPNPKDAWNTAKNSYREIWGGFF